MEVWMEEELLEAGDEADALPVTEERDDAPEAFGCEETEAVEQEPTPESAGEMETPMQEHTGAKGTDYLGQVRELLAGYPEMEGREIPEEVARACVSGESTLVQAYGQYRGKLLQQENSRLRSELAALQQQRENTKRAPVIGTAHAPNSPQRGEDPFLRGFNSED